MFCIIYILSSNLIGNSQQCHVLNLLYMMKLFFPRIHILYDVILSIFCHLHVFFIKNQLIRNVHVGYRRIKKLLELHFIYMAIFLNKRPFIHIYIHSFRGLSKRNQYVAEKIDSNK